MTKKRKFRSQPRTLGEQRIPMGTCVQAEIEDAIQDEMRHFGVSRSFVIANCCAYALGVTLSHRQNYRKLQLVKTAQKK